MIQLTSAQTLGRVYKYRVSFMSTTNHYTIQVMVAHADILFGFDDWKYITFTMVYPQWRIQLASVGGTSEYTHIA